MDYFSGWLRTGSNPANINRFWSCTEKRLLTYLEIYVHFENKKKMLYKNSFYIWVDKCENKSKCLLSTTVHFLSSNFFLQIYLPFSFILFLFDSTFIQSLGLVFFIKVYLIVLYFPNISMLKLTFRFSLRTHAGRMD